MKRRIAFYTRVSTDEQTAENQEHALRAWAARAGLEDSVVAHYTDHAVSGRRQGRAGLAKLERAVAARQVSAVAVTALDRLGRSLRHLTAILAEWDALGCQLVTLREGVDTSTPAGRALLSMAAVFAEFESELIRERTRAGLARARAQGKRLGPPPLPRTRHTAVEQLLLSGAREAEIVARAAVGKGTVYRARQRLRKRGLIA